MKVKVEIRGIEGRFPFGTPLAEIGRIPRVAREVRLGAEFPTSGFRQTGSYRVLASNWRRSAVRGRRSFHLPPPFDIRGLLGLMGPETAILSRGGCTLRVP